MKKERIITIKKRSFQKHVQKQKSLFPLEWKKASHWNHTASTALAHIPTSQDTTQLHYQAKISNFPEQFCPELSGLREETLPNRLTLLFYLQAFLRTCFPQASNKGTLTIILLPLFSMDSQLKAIEFSKYVRWELK